LYLSSHFIPEQRKIFINTVPHQSNIKSINVGLNIGLELFKINKISKNIKKYRQISKKYQKISTNIKKYQNLSKIIKNYQKISTIIFS
jgi:hypothetical protein